MTLPPASHAHAGVAETLAEAKASAFRMPQIEVVFKIVKLWPEGLTAAEIAKEARKLGRQMDHVQTQRRLSDLLRMGRVCKDDARRRTCSVNGSLMATWKLPTEKQGDLM